MVKGMDLFKTHFQTFTGSYILIGGAACDIAMETAGAGFRTTKDLDIVLSVEALDPAFVRAFWDFIRQGRYEHMQKSTDKKQFYRFYKPQDDTYPHMLELFSRKPDALAFSGEGRLTPVPVEEDLSSLSAILLNDAYYEFIKAGKLVRDGLSLLPSEFLIPLKAYAWLDLTKRRNNGEPVDDKDIRKHRSDVLRLFLIVDPTSPISDIPAAIKGDLKEFIEQNMNLPIEIKPFGYRAGTGFKDILNSMKVFYSLE